MWMTWANALSLTRLLVAPLAAFAIGQESWLAAAALFWVAVATDLVDGPIARKQRNASPLGGKIDHGSDATWVVCATAALAYIDVLTPLLPVLIAVAFVQYVVDSGAHRQSPLRASQLGRWNGILYFVLIGVAINQPATGLTIVPAAGLAAAGWLLTLSTAVSMTDRAIAILVSRRRT